MDALVYEDHPLATYLEAEAVPYESSREVTPPHSPFAPTGLPDLRRTFGAIGQSRLSVSHTSTEQLLERFRYVIVASQLLADGTGSQPAVSDSDTVELNTITLRGALVTAALSFFVAWTLHSHRTTKGDFRTESWLRFCIYILGLLLSGACLAYLIQRQYTKHIQKSAIQALSRLVDNSHAFDSAASSTVRFIQEVEIVARGYELSSPLPPISRIEDKHTIRRCRTLRTELATTLKSLIILMVDSHNVIQPYVNSTDLQRYHDIYEVSLVEFSQAVQLARQTQAEVGESLKEIRFSIQFHAIARKVFLCDLLALRQTTRKTRLSQWRRIMQLLREIEVEVRTRQQNLSNALSMEEWGDGQHDRRSTSVTLQNSCVVPHDTTNMKARMRRFDDIAQSVRALNAKVHLTKEEMECLNSSSSDDMSLALTLAKHYESLGTDIRSLVVEWEKGRNLLLSNMDAEKDNRYSRSSSTKRSSLSSSPSLGGITVVDGGPTEALRLLTGDMETNHTDDCTALKKGIEIEEQVFEAIAARPVHKRMSIAGLTREEKMAKLQEDRRKRATIQEQSENTTSMLRELRMVIKHRPQASIGMPSQRITSI